MADLPRPPDVDVSDVRVRAAETFDDAVAIHRFLLVVLREEIEQRGPINAEKSLNEILRVIQNGAAYMAIKGDVMIGTLGIVMSTWWHSDTDFLADRWDAVLPEYRHAGVQEILLAEAKKIADIAGLKFVHHGKIREMKSGIGLMFPRIYSPIHTDTPTLGSA